MSENQDNITLENQDVQKQETDNIDYKAILDELETVKAEAAKNRSIKAQLVKERDELRNQLKSKDTPKDADDYKTLYQQLLSENQKMLSEKKQETVQGTLKERLKAQGIESETQLKAAMKLIDNGLIDFDDADIDEVGIDAAVLKLRKDYDFLFEKKVPSTKPKLPADKVPSSDKEITRAEWDKLDPRAHADLIAKGYKIT